MQIITKSSSLTIFRQEAEWDEVNKVLEVEGQSQYSDISVGVEFNCAFEMTKANIVERFQSKVVLITRDEERLELLRTGKVGRLSLKFNQKPESIISLLKSQVITLGVFSDRLFNIYASKIISIEPIENNRQVLSWLNAINETDNSNYICFVARSIDEEVMIDQKFDLLWNMKNVEELEGCRIELARIYNNKRQSQNVLFNRIPSIVLLKIEGSPLFLDWKDMISLDTGKQIMLGKRNFELDLYPA